MEKGIKRTGKNVRSRNSSPSADPSIFALTPRIPHCHMKLLRKIFVD